MTSATALEIRDSCEENRGLPLAHTHLTPHTHTHTKKRKQIPREEIRLAKVGG